MGGLLLHHGPIARLLAPLLTFGTGAAAAAGAIYVFHPAVLEATPPPATFQTNDALPPVIIYTSPPPAPPRTEPAPEKLANAEPPPALLEPVQQGLTASEIFELQARLRTLGLDPGPIDGVAGPRTAGAVMRYEERQGSTATGALDRALLQRLRRDSENAQVATAP